MVEITHSAFDWSRATFSHRDHLPHLRQENVIYFVTFRLGDSLPSHGVATLKKRRDEWLRLHPFPHTSEEHQEYKRLWSARIENLLDAGHGSCLFRHLVCRAGLEEAMRRFDDQYYRLGPFVIMPNHVHALIQLSEAGKLGVTIKAWKATSSRHFATVTGRRGSYWMNEYFDHIVRDEESGRRFVRYIQENPKGLEAGSFTVGEGSLKLP